MTIHRATIAPERLQEWLLQRLSELSGNPGGTLDAESSIESLGLDSLKMTEVSGELEELLGKRLSPTLLFDYPTIDAIIGYLSSHEDSLTAISGIQRLPPSSLPFALSPAQRLMWVMHKIDSNGRGLHVGLIVQVKGKFSYEAFQLAFNQVVQRHESFRTRFVEGKEGPTQLVDEYKPVRFDRIDLSDWSADLRRARAVELGNAVLSAPFDIEIGNLWRGAAYRIGEEEQVFAFVMHHIVTDGESIRIIFDEMETFYRAHLDGVTEMAPSRPVQCRDYVAWHHLRSNVEEASAHKRFWNDTLAGCVKGRFIEPNVKQTEEPKDLARFENVMLKHKTADRLRELGAQNGATLFMTLMAGIVGLLNRYSSSEDIQVVFPIANRRSPALINSVGYFANMMILRTSVDPSASFRQLIARVRAASLGAFAHQDLPFQEQFSDIPGLSLAGSIPPFQILFLYEADSPPSGASDLGLEVSELDFWRSPPDMELAIGAANRREGYELSCNFRCRLFTPTLIKRLLNHLGNFLTAAAVDPDGPLSDLPIMGEEERHRHLDEWSGVCSKPDLEIPTLAERFEAQVRRSPDSIAVTDGVTTLTYGELNQRSNQLAHLLLELGVRSETPIGLRLNRTVDMIVGVYGILKAGGAYVPVDVLHPERRQTHVLKNSGAAIVVSDEPGWEPAQSRDRIDVVCLPDQIEALRALSVDNPGVKIAPDHLAYIIHTSGSTGLPKGVEMQHESVCNIVDAVSREISFKRTDILATVASLCFDISVLDIFMPLSLGGALRIVADADTRDGRRLGRILDEEKISVLETTPSVWQLLLESGWNAKAPIKGITGGDTLSRPVANELLNAGVTLWNMYGPTESAVFATAFKVGRAEGPPSIGRPMEGYEVYILDDHLNPSPEGITGEIYVGGVALARGYRNQSTLTSETFVTHPFSSIPGRKLYKSGDLGRYGSDGNIEFLGRCDSQIKIRGYRIEPQEVEAVLMRHPNIEACAVTSVPGPRGEPRLVAHIVSGNADSIPRAGEIRRFLQESLPDYMIPAVYVKRESLRLTENGKIDRKDLVSYDLSSVDQPESLQPASTPTEQTIFEIWRRILDIDHIDVHHNFFDLGGDSMLAAQTIYSLSRRLDLNLPLQLLMEYQTMSNLARAIDSGREGFEQLKPNVPRILTKPRDHAPLSYAQERLWRLNRQHPEKDPFTTLIGIEIEGTVDLEIVQGALRRLESRHPALRTTFPRLGERLVQVIRQDGELKVSLSDISGGSIVEARRKLEEEVLNQRASIFDIEAEPPVRATLYRLSTTLHVLILTVHRIIYDDISEAILRHDFEVYYRAISAGKRAVLPELPFQYDSYAAEQLLWIEDPAARRAKVRSWRETLTDSRIERWHKQLIQRAPLVNLGQSHLPLERDKRPFSIYRRNMSIALVEEIAKFARAEHSIDYAVYMSAFLLLLHDISGQAEVVTWSPFANRSDERFGNIVGRFSNSVLIHSTYDAGIPLRKYFRAVRDTCLHAQAHPDVPMSLVFEDVDPSFKLEAPMPFQTLFALWDELPRPADCSPPIFYPSLVPGPPPSRDMTLMVTRDGNKSVVDLSFNTTDIGGLDGKTLLDRYIVNLQRLIRV